MNTLVVGMTQSGKSTAAVPALAAKDMATVVCDPHNSLALKLVALGIGK